MSLRAPDLREYEVKSAFSGLGTEIVQIRAILPAFVNLYVTPPQQWGYPDYMKCRDNRSLTAGCTLPGAASERWQVKRNSSKGNELPAVESIWFASTLYVQDRRTSPCVWNINLHVPYITRGLRSTAVQFCCFSVLFCVFLIIRVISLFLCFLYNIVLLRGALDHGGSKCLFNRYGIWTYVLACERTGRFIFSCCSRYLTHANSM